MTQDDNKSNIPHQFDERGLEQTQNTRGFMHTLNEISEAFIDFASRAPGLAVDIGAAYGVATIPVANQHVTICACDMAQSHLDEIVRRLEPDSQEYLTCQHGKFPADIHFSAGSVGAIHFSHILHFLSPGEMDTAIDKLSNWLATGGKVFIASYSPYLGCFQKFIPQYEERLAAGVKWPCWVEGNIRDYLVAPENIRENLPDTMNYLGLKPLTNALHSAGFHIEQASYLDATKNHIPKGLILDGREWIGVIAKNFSKKHQASFSLTDDNILS